VEYLRAHEGSVSVIAQSGLSGATFNNPIHSVIWVGTDGSMAQVAGVLAHETTHMEQGHTVVTQADEIQAYQVQGRILDTLGVTGAANPWGTPAAQLGTAANARTIALLYRQSLQYENWPIARPADLPHLAFAGAREYGTVGLARLDQAAQALSVQAVRFSIAMQPVASRTIAPFTPWIQPGSGS